jgi:hydrogenase maturation protein HypF
VLTGGLFQNALLGRLARDGLQHANFSPYLPTRIPPNDGGIAAGQALHDAWYQS